jgi:hypothetical protein
MIKSIASLTFIIFIASANFAMASGPTIVRGSAQTIETYKVCHKDGKSGYRSYKKGSAKVVTSGKVDTVTVGQRSATYLGNNIWHHQFSGKDSCYLDIKPSGRKNSVQRIKATAWYGQSQNTKVIKLYNSLVVWVKK